MIPYPPSNPDVSPRRLGPDHQPLPRPRPWTWPFALRVRRSDVVRRRVSTADVREEVSPGTCDIRVSLLLHNPECQASLLPPISRPGTHVDPSLESHT